MNEEVKFMYDCFLCQRPYQQGPHIHNGRRVPAWDILLCNTCRSGNWDGIVLSAHPRLQKHLEERGIPIKLNDAGHLPIPG